MFPPPPSGGKYGTYLVTTTRKIRLAVHPFIHLFIWLSWATKRKHTHAHTHTHTHTHE